MNKEICIIIHRFHKSQCIQSIVLCFISYFNILDIYFYFLFLYKDITRRSASTCSMASDQKAIRHDAEKVLEMVNYLTCTLPNLITNKTMMDADKK